ncbi:MAG: prenyltransferase/squalene oxidase repeat-containing protein [Planctomycetota bacterium]
MNADQRRLNVSARGARLPICVHLRSSAVAYAVCFGLALAKGAAAGAARDSAEISPRSRTAIERGLAHLAATQLEDGSWPGGQGRSTGIVASCSLAFMACGHSPGRGKYGKAVARSIRWLVTHAQLDGLLYGPGMAGGPMYHHGLATLALAEAWGMTQDRKIREALKRAVALIVRCQNHKGGWRYHPRVADDDMSVTVMQLMALRAAKDAGIFVPKDVIDSGIGYVKSCHNSKESGKDGGFGYRPGGGSGFARAGAGVLSLQVAGDYRAKEVKQGVGYLMTHKPVGGKKVGSWYFYGHYYAAQGIYQSQSIGEWGSRAWRSWYPAITKELVGTQQKDGSWRGSYGQYSTAMALLVLAIPYRYLPIYER